MNDAGPPARATVRIEALYALPLNEFTPARDALAADMRAAGDSTSCAAVKALRKPSVAAWLVNQIARAYPEDIAALFDAGARLRAAQQRAVRARADRELLDAMAAERALVDALVWRATTIAGAEAIASASTRERAAATLYATTVDDEVRARVASGTLTKEARRAGFGETTGLSLVQSPVPLEGAGEVSAHDEDPREATRRARDEDAREATRRQQSERAVDEERAQRAAAIQDAERSAARRAREAVTARAAADTAASVAENLAAAAAAAQETARRARERADATRLRADEADRLAREAVVTLERVNAEPEVDP